MLASGMTGKYFDKLRNDGKDETPQLNAHRLVLDRDFKKFKCPDDPEAIGDRLVVRFRIANSLFEDGGEASVGFDAEIIDQLLTRIKTVDTSQPFGGEYLRLAEHPMKGYAILEDRAPDRFTAGGRSPGRQR